MKTRMFNTVALLLALALLAAAPGMAQEGTEPGVQSQRTFPQGSTDTINFQGRLSDSGGTPLTGSYDVRFSIYDAPTGGAVAWGPEMHSGVPVDGGLFTVQLGESIPLDATVFDGSDRWLEVEVWNGTAWETLSPRLSFSSAAYAISAGSLPSGTTISGTTDGVLNVAYTGGGESGMQAPSAPSSPYVAALVGRHNSSSGAGVFGQAEAPTGNADGVYGRTDSVSKDAAGVEGAASASFSDAKGVIGTTNGTTSSAAGVYGEAFEGQATGVYGHGAGAGVRGITWSATGETYGVYGESFSESGTGVQGHATSIIGVTYGVFGRSDSRMGTAVKGHATSKRGETYAVSGWNESSEGRAVHGWASSSSGFTYGGYFENDSHQGIGVYGLVRNETGLTYGGYFYSNSNAGIGVYGQAGSSSGFTYGGLFESASQDGSGVLGKATAKSGKTAGGRFTTDSNDGSGVSGWASSSTGSTYGGHFESASNAGTGVYGEASSGSGSTYGGDFTSHSDNGVGVRGHASREIGPTVGVEGWSESSGGRGVYGWASASSGATYGVYGQSDSDGGSGVYGQATGAGVGVKAESESGNVIEGYGGGFLGALVFKVDNSGNVFADGTYSSPAADFAEMLPGSEGLEPGDVLAIGPDGRVVKASTQNPTALLGVYSSAPAFLGGADISNLQPATSNIPVAIMGIVPVKVTAENGPIRPNDPLTVSSLPGYAAKAIPLFTLDGGEGVYAGGTILGRALQGLDSGEGVIQVLLQLR